MHPRGRLTLTIHSSEGELVEERRTKNRVLRSGAELIAGLFTGKREGGIDRVRFGFGTDPLPVDATELRTRMVMPDPSVMLLPFFEFGPEVFLEQKNVVVETRADAVIVKIRVPYTPGEDVKAVSEAALFAGQSSIYNHVLFEPVDMTTGQAITFFWEIEFPFGA